MHLAPLFAHVEVTIYPADLTDYEEEDSLEETLSVRLKCFASEGQVFQMASLALMTAKPSGEWSLVEEHTVRKNILDDGKQMEFALKLFSGREYKFGFDYTRCGHGDCGCERKNSMVLHFR